MTLQLGYHHAAAVLGECLVYMLIILQKMAGWGGGADDGDTNKQKTFTGKRGACRFFTSNSIQDY